MKQKQLEEVWYFLDFCMKEKLEYPCDECGYYECKNFSYNDMLKKRHAEFNIIDHRDCLKRNKEEFEKLNKLRRHPDFKPWSHKPCSICKKKFFKDDMKMKTEIEKDDPENPKKSFKIEFIDLCKKCNRSYAHRKDPLHEGYRRG